jgi:hypothetical protein
MSNLKMSPPVGYTCRDIDSVIQSLKYAQQCISAAIDNVETLETDDLTQTIISELKEAIKHIDVESDLEDLRSANSDFRHWGYELVEHIEKIENEQ